MTPLPHAKETQISRIEVELSHQILKTCLRGDTGLSPKSFSVVGTRGCKKN